MEIQVMDNKPDNSNEINENLRNINAALTAINCNLGKLLGILTTPAPPTIILPAVEGAVEGGEPDIGFTDVSLLIYSLQSALFEISGLSGVNPHDLYILHDISFLVGRDLAKWEIDLETAYSAILESARRAGFKVSDIKVEVYQEILDGIQYWQQSQGLN